MNEIMEILSPVLGEELAKDVISHRKGLKCPLTPRGAKALLKQYQLAGDPIAAAEHHLNMGWRGFDHTWMKPKGWTGTFHDTNNPMPARSANYGRPEPVALPEQLTEQDKENRRQMVARLRAEGIIGRTMQ